MPKKTSSATTASKRTAKAAVPAKAFPKTVKAPPVALDRAKLIATLDEDTIDSLDAIPRTINRLVEPADPLDFADPSDFEHEILMALTKTHGRGERTWKASSVVGDLVVVDGGLHVQGNLTLANHLFVLGDLRVDGSIHCERPHCILAVGGKIRAGHFESFKAYIHALEVHVDGFAHFRTDGYIWAIDTIKARILWDDSTHGYFDADFESAKPNIRADVVVHGTPDRKSSAKLEQIFGAKSFDDPFELFRVVRTGG